MLTGRRARSTAKTWSMTLSRVSCSGAGLGRASARRPAARPHVSSRCLQKDPKQRVGDIRDVRLALEGAFETAVPQTAAPATSPSTRPMAALWIVACRRRRGRGSRSPFPRCGICAKRRHRHRPRRASRSSPPPPTDPFPLRCRPTVGRSSSWLPAMARPPLAAVPGADAAQPLAGTEGAAYPFWSPDSRSVGFFADGELKRLDLGGGPPQTLPTRHLRPGGGTWNADGVILFTHHSAEPAVPRAGHGRRSRGRDEARPAVEPPVSLLSARWPTVPVLCARNAGKRGDLPGRARLGRNPTADAGRDGRVSTCPRDGCCGCARERSWPSVWTWRRKRSPAIRDPGRSGGHRWCVSERRLGSDARVWWPIGRAGAAGGNWRGSTVRAWRAARSATPMKIRQTPRFARWPPRRGGPHGAGQYRHLASGRRPHEPIHVRCGPRSYPVWSPDGSRIVFSSNRKGQLDLYQMLTRGGAEERLVESPGQGPQPLVRGRPVPALSQRRPARNATSG